MDMASITFDVNEQALAVLHYLARREIDEPEGSLLFVRTRPLYNGRERGICLLYRLRFNKGAQTGGACLAVFFGEHRNSDSIFVETWEPKRLADDFNDVPLQSDRSEETYEQRIFFEYGRVGDVVKHIGDLVHSWLSRNATPKEA